ncbi:MAG: hypothetical protein ACM31L_17095 [Actinomycetota bacterium]
MKQVWGAFALVAMAAAVPAEAFDAGGFTLSPVPPAQVGAADLSSQQAMDLLGWQMFVAYNWPAAADQRGVADPTKPFGTPGPVVWETWKSPNEVFYPDGSQPPPWEVYGTLIPPECTAAGAKAGSGPMVLSDILVNRTSQAQGGSLTDQNGNLVHYSIAFNKPVFDFIYNNGYYSIAGQGSLSGPVEYGSGTAEMKAAWRVLMPEEANAVKSRFLRRTAYVYTPTTDAGPASCKLQEVGLIGLHFDLKITYPDGKPYWLMATFEQVDNVPPFQTPFQPGKDAAHTLPYSLFSKSCYTKKCQYNWSTEFGRPITQPTQVIRVNDLDDPSKVLNPAMQQLFAQAVAGSPWQYYEMITTQYPTKPDQPPMAGPTPATSANTTMETYLRGSSCIDCHYTAKDVNGKWFADYSFMLAQACPKPLFPSAHSSPSPACQPAPKAAN